MNPHIAFIGGGNMASAIIGGLLRNGTAADHIWVVEPYAATRDTLTQQFKVNVMAEPGPGLAQAAMVVWAVKPQTFKDAAQQCKPHTAGAVHLSVAAGIRSDSIAAWLGTERVVRSMPNTPALIGKGMTALFARDAITPEERAQVDAIIATTGDSVWVSTEAQLDAVTAISGSGPAYVFYFVEAMTQAGADMGLPRDQAYKLALGTFSGATALAQQSSEAPEVLRQRVTSKGGTTHAAITSMDDDKVKDLFIRALFAARHRAQALGDEFGAP